MKGIEKMTALILSESEAERENKLDKAKREAEALLSGYRKKADAIRTVEAEKAAKDAAAMLERALATAKQIERNRKLEARGILLDRVYASALENLCPDNPSSMPEYLDMLKAIFDSVLSEELEAEKLSTENDPYCEHQVPKCFALRLNRRDRDAIGTKLLAYAEKAVSKSNRIVVLDDQIAQVKGGFILVCGDIELNCSLEQYMNKLRSTTEGEICRLLFA